MPIQDRADCLAKAESCGVEDRHAGALTRYLFDQIPPGHFMTAVLSNDLKETFGRGDAGSIANLRSILTFLHSHFPANVWGTEDRVDSYLRTITKMSGV